MESSVAVLHLPDDLLADVLGRLPARSLAASRCVSRSWRGLVDDRRLLLPHLLPHSVDGLLLSFTGYGTSHVFAPPPTSTRPRIDRVMFRLFNRFYDLCNGLVLFKDGPMYVCNPATRRGAWLPDPDVPGDLDLDTGRRRAFDPAVSPHWEVLLSPLEIEKTTHHDDDGGGMDEWPPPTWTWHALSSRTMAWEERVFVRQGKAAGTVAQLLWQWLANGPWWDQHQPVWRSSAYCQGQLYLHCRGAYVCRLSLSTNMHQVIKSPIDLAEYHQGLQSSRIGRSQHGVYFAAIDNMAQLRVWILREEPSDGTMEWLLNHRSVVNLDHEQMRCDGPWRIMRVFFRTRSAVGGRAEENQ